MRKLLAFLCLTTGLSIASADPTTNVVIPIADSLGHREAFYSHTLSGSDRFDRPYGHYSVFTVGLLERFELGAATDHMGFQTWSIKSVLWDERGTALAVGVLGIRGRNGNPYAVGRVDAGIARIHGGVGRFDGIATGMVGFDMDYRGWFTLQGDHTAGPAGASWVALSREWSGGFYSQFAVGKPTRGDGWEHFVYLGYGFSF